MHRRTPEERYRYNKRKQDKLLDEFLTKETQYADDLSRWYVIRKQEMPIDEYRGYAFFVNKEYQNKPGSLALVYEMYNRCMDELPGVTKENAFDLLCYRFKMYAEVLKAGGYDGQSIWG